MSNNDTLTDLDVDFSKNIVIKIGFFCIILIITYNIISSLIFFNNTKSNFNSLSILINSGLGIIIGFVIYDLGVVFAKKIGEYAGISKIIFDIILIIFNLFYTDYLVNLETSLTTFIQIFGFDSTTIVLSLVVYYSSISPFWFQIVYFSINLLIFIEIALIFNFFYTLGIEKENNYFKMTSVSYLLSYIFMLIFYYIPFTLFQLSSILLQNIFLFLSLQTILSLKIRFIEQINPNYKPIHEEYI